MADNSYEGGLNLEGIGVTNADDSVDEKQTIGKINTEKLAEESRETNGGKGQSVRENIADYLPDSRLKDSMLRKAEANREKRKERDEYKRNKKEAIEKHGRKDWKEMDALDKEAEKEKQKQAEVTLARSNELERELEFRDLERKWQSDLPTSQKGSSYFQSTRPKPSLNVKGLGTDYHREDGYKQYKDLDVMNQQLVDRDKPVFKIAPSAHKFDKSPLNISLTTPIRQARRDAQFRDIAQGLNKK